MLFTGLPKWEKHRKEKKPYKTVKEKLLYSLKENDTEEVEFNITRINNPREAINIANHYEEIMKTRNKKVIGILATQEQMLKKVKDMYDFIENIRLSRSTVYFKIGIYKFLKKFPVLKNSTLSTHYFKNHFK